jgi:hypothetical protein
MRFVRRALMAPFVVLAIVFAFASEAMDTAAEWLSPSDR